MCTEVTHDASILDSSSNLCVWEKKQQGKYWM